MNLEAKEAVLATIIKMSEKVVIAFSGGVDSSYLAKVCYTLLKEKAIALTIDSPFIPRSEMEEAKQVAEEIGIRHQIIQLDKMDDEILGNDEDRCYHCKKVIFQKIIDFAENEKVSRIFDGSNLDDLDDIRPGIKALKELKIESPMVQAEMTKSDIRSASKLLNLSTFDKPSLACLASRIPYGQVISERNLHQVENAEKYLLQKGFKQVRVRCHDNIARIEVDPKERTLFFDTCFMDEISTHLKNLGFRYVTLELAGYKTGNLNI